MATNYRRKITSRHTVLLDVGQYILGKYPNYHVEAGGRVLGKFHTCAQAKFAVAKHINEYLNNGFKKVGEEKK